MKSIKWNLKHVPEQVCQSATALKAAWAKACSKPSRYKRPNIRPFLGGSTTWKLLHQQYQNVAAPVSITDLDWFELGIDQADESLLALYTEKNGELLLQACEGAEHVPSPRDPITQKVLYYLFKWHGEDINMGPPVTYHNFSFLIDPDTGDVILDPNVAEHENDIALFFEKNIIRSYHLDTLIRQSYVNPYQINILAWFFKSYHVLIRDYHKSFHPETALQLNNLFKYHPLIIQSIREKLISHYFIKRGDFISEQEIDAFLSQLKTLVKNIVGDTQPREEELTQQIEKLEQQNASLAQKLSSAKIIAKAHEENAIAHEAKVAQYENKIQNLQQKYDQLKKENKTLPGDIKTPQNPIPPSPQPEPIKNKPEQELNPYPIKVIGLISCLIAHATQHGEYDDITPSNEDAEIFWEKHWKNISPTQHLRMMAVNGLYSSVSSDEQATYFFNVFRGILNITNLCLNNNPDSLHSTLLKIDDMMMFLDVQKTQRACPKERLDIILYELTRTQLTLNGLDATGTSGRLSANISMLIDYLENQPTGRYLLLKSMSNIDMLIHHFVAHTDLIKSRYLENKINNKLNYDSSLQKFYRKYDELRKEHKINALELALCFKSFTKATQIIGYDELLVLLKKCKEEDEHLCLYEKWNVHLQHYYDNRNSLSSEKIQTLAQNTIKDIYQEFKRGFPAHTMEDLHTLHFIFFNERVIRTKCRGLPTDDPLYTCLSPLLSPQLHQKLHNKNMEAHAPAVREKVLTHMKNTNLFGLPPEILADDVALLAEHHCLIKHYMTHCMSNGKGSDKHYTNVFVKMLNLLRPDPYSALLTEEEKEMIYKARLFCKGDKNSALQFKRLLNKNSESLQQYLKLGKVLLTHTDSLILDMSHIFQQSEEQFQAIQTPSDGFIEHLSKRIDILANAEKECSSLVLNVADFMTVNHNESLSDQIESKSHVTQDVFF